MTLIDAASPELKVHPGRKLEATVVACLIADGEDFRTRPVDDLQLALDGAVGDIHRGYTRASGSREPWYPRGTEIRSGRHLSIVSLEEMEEVAARLNLVMVDPGLIGANLVIAGIPRFSYLPPGTRLFFPSGAVVVEAMNAPCRFAGRALADAHAGREDLEVGFVPAAKRRRGVVASVERAGRVSTGATVSVRVPEQWIWAG
ncbi:MAG TPA: molybdenum cofactor sulfurase [Methylomirabilota bacterium]|nr:molybdenum cofactor sulfurase [Methylomirabilota bacterium]